MSERSDYVRDRLARAERAHAAAVAELRAFPNEPQALYALARAENELAAARREADDLRAHGRH